MRFSMLQFTYMFSANNDRVEKYKFFRDIFLSILCVNCKSVETERDLRYEIFRYD